MYFDLVSDLHIDRHKDNPFDWPGLKNPESHILVDAGDDSNTPSESQQLLLAARELYDVVIAVDGNHHHYNSDMPVQEAMAEFSAFAAANDIVYLDGTNEYLTEGVLFIGCNGWYDFGIGEPEFSTSKCRELWLKEMNDRYIDFGIIPKPVTIRNNRKLKKAFELSQGPLHHAFEQAALLTLKVAAAQTRPEVDRIVVITHTCPVKQGLVWKPFDREWNLMCGGYGNSQMQKVIDADTTEKVIDADTTAKLKLWVYGHTHSSHDFDLGHTRFVANPRGYPHEKDWHGPVPLAI